MTFGREKRLWLGALALLVPIPLPFNQVLEWPFLFVYALLVIHFLQRAERGTWTNLSNWALNILGLFYLPIFFVDLRSAFIRGNAVTALLHLILFLLVVKLYSIRREKDKWHIVVAIFFLFVAAMATSSHVSIVPYLLTFLILGLLLLARFAHLHMMTSGAEEHAEAQGLPFRAPLTLGTLLVLLVAVPLFATMPRIREPYILGRGSGSGGIARTTGFSDSVDLSITSSIRANRNVAMRVQYEDEIMLGDPSNLRFKGAAYDRYQNRNWYRALQRAEALTPQDSPTVGRLFELGVDQPAINKAVLFMEPLNSFSLVLPVETLRVRTDRQTALGIDPGGAVLMPVRPIEALRYEVDLADGPVIHARLDDAPDGELSALDPSGLTPQIIELAEQVMGEGDDDARIDHLERHLLTQYAYTLDYLGRTGENPLDDFLFVYKSGHCEYFASAMVLMLRSQGIPARFVTGFLGAELNPIESYYVIRQQNAHAWVEAYTETRGWRIYDPTPPDGRPVVAEQSLSLLVSQVYDYITFRWDRYVLTYGAEDQDSFFRRIRERVREFWGKVRELASKDEPETAPPTFDQEIEANEEERAPWVWQPNLPLFELFALFAAAVGALILWNRHRPPTGAAAYVLLRRRLERAGLPISDALAPLDLEQRAVARFSLAADSIRYIVSLYVSESFAERELAGAERRGLRDATRTLEDALREHRRLARRERRRKRFGALLPSGTRG